jgi:hypothetical protein
MFTEGVASFVKDSYSMDLKVYQKTGWRVKEEGACFQGRRVRFTSDIDSAARFPPRRHPFIFAATVASAREKRVLQGGEAVSRCVSPPRQPPAAGVAVHKVHRRGSV